MICKYFLPFRMLPFHSVDGFLCCAEAFWLPVVPFINFFFYCFTFGVKFLKKSLPRPMSRSLPPVFSSSFMVSGLIFKSLIHFVCGIRWWYCFILFHVAVQFFQHYLLKRLFFTSVSLLLSCIEGHHCHLSKFHIYVLVYCIGVFLSGLLHSV